MPGIDEVRAQDFRRQAPRTVFACLIGHINLRRDIRLRAQIGFIAGIDILPIFRHVIGCFRIRKLPAYITVRVLIARAFFTPRKACSSNKNNHE